MAMASKDLPRDIVSDILSRLPIKSLVRFRCVSKPWLDLITYSRFPYWVLRGYRECDHGQDCMHSENSIFLSVNKRKEVEGSESKLYSFGGGHQEDSFKLAVEINTPPLGGNSIKLKTGSCDGMVCVSVDDETLVLWNPSTRDHKVLPLPINIGVCRGVCGLGFDLSLDDYKVVSVCKKQVFLFSVKRNFWKNLGDFPFFLFHVGIPLNGCLYWAAGKKRSTANQIVCFDLADETFREVSHPPFDSNHRLRLLLSRKSLCVFCETDQSLWQMKERKEEHGTLEETWTRLMILPKIKKDNMQQVLLEPDDGFGAVLPLMWGNHAVYRHLYPMCFTKSGKLVVSVEDKKFVLYNPTHNENYENIQIGLGDSPHRNSIVYAESLISPNGIRGMNDID